MLAKSANLDITLKMTTADSELSNWLDFLVAEDGFFFEDNRQSSRELFLSFIRKQMQPDGTVIVDCSGVISNTCYDKWLSMRTRTVPVPEETFRKALLAHLTCADKSSAPFPEEVETALIELLRQKCVWGCFKGKLDNKGKPITIGKKGLRCLGYHQKLRKEMETGLESSGKRTLENIDYLPAQKIQKL